MSRKKRPFDFAEPAFAEDDPPPAATRDYDTQDPSLDDPFTLEMPAIPADPKAVAAGRHDLPMAAHNAFAEQADSEAAARGVAIYVFAAAATILWAGGLTAFSLGYRSHLGPFEYEPFAVVVLGLLGLAPIGLIWIGAFALRQASRLLAESRRLQILSDQMLGPAALAAAQTGSTVDAIRLEIDSAMQTVAQARGQLLQLRHGLAEESKRLRDAVTGSERASAGMVKSLSAERENFSALTNRLDVQANDIGEAITRQARMVAEASDLAQAQIHEAEAALAARAADLAAAAGEASDAARMAGDDLSRQAVRLEAAGATVGEQVQAIEEGLGQQRASLLALAHSMRADQEDLSVQFETQKAQFIEVINRSEQEALQMSGAATRGADTLRQLIGEAADQLREMSEQAQSERDLLGGAALQSLGAFSEAAAFERRALEDETHRAIRELSDAAEVAHKSAEAASESARLKVEQLAEAAFAAGQKADAAFEERLLEARSLIDRSVGLVDEAGARTSAKLDQGVASARQALDELQRGLAEIEARSARLPADAETRGLQIKAALDTATQALLDSARTAAAELQSIDSAFQERVKRNYEMLSEAVRLMGVMGGSASARASGGLPPSGFSPRPGPALRPRLGDPGEVRRAPAPASPVEEPPRRRLKLTPTTSDEDLKSVFETAADRRAPDRAQTGGEANGDTWTWTELLSSLDDGPAGDGALEQTLIEEVEALGIDPAALLPTSRIDDIAAALETGDTGGAREIAHRQAPAAIRKLARRVLTDKVLRAQADRFIQQYDARLREAVGRGQSRAAIARALNSPIGRVYLMFDAAVGDLS